MKFSNILAFAGLACAAIPKAPIVERDEISIVERKVAVLEERQTTVFGTLEDIVADLDDAVAAALAVIGVTADEIAGTVGLIPPALIALLRQNIAALTGILDDATDDIRDVLDDLVDDIANGVITLTQAQIDLLISIIGSVESIINNIEVTLEVALGDLPRLVLIALRSQISALNDILAPFIEPLRDLVDGILDVAGSLNLTVTGLQNAFTELNNILTSILGFLGLGGLLGRILALLSKGTL